MKMKKVLLSIGLIIAIIMITGLSTMVYARDNLAYAAGTTNGINRDKSWKW